MTRSGVARLGGLARAKILSPERRKEIALMGGRAFVQKYNEALMRVPEAPLPPIQVDVHSDEDAFKRARNALCRIFAKAERGETMGGPDHVVVEAARIIYAHAARAEGGSGSEDSIEDALSRRACRNQASA